MSFFGSPPIKQNRSAIVVSIGSTLNPSAPSPPIPSLAPVFYDNLTTETGVPILVWALGPFSPAELYNDYDRVGWCYDAAGQWWIVYQPVYKDLINKDALGRRIDGKQLYLGQNNYLFDAATGPPEYSGPSLLDQVGEAFEKVIIPVAIGILTIVQPEIGIAAALVYSKVVLIASGAPLSAIAFSAMGDAIKSQIPSYVGKGLFDEGVSAAGSLPQIRAAREKINALGTEAAEALGLKKALETGIATGQSKLIQARAIQILRAQLPNDYNRGVLDTALANNASITDIAFGMFSTQAEGAARLNNAIAQASVEVDPSTKTAVKTVTVPVMKLAQSGKPIPLPGSKTTTGSGSSSSSSSGLGTVAVVAGGGYIAYKFLPKIIAHFSHGKK